MNVKQLEDLYKNMCAALGKECDTELMDKDGKFKNIELHEPTEDDGWNEDETMLFDFSDGEFTNSSDDRLTTNNLLEIIKKYTEDFMSNVQPWIMVLKHVKTKEDVQ